jgi:hypothetical protein
MPDVTKIVQNFFLRHLPALRLFDLGINPETGFIKKWYITSILPSLTYLRLPLRLVCDLWRVISTRPLSNTLRQLHITITDHPWNTEHSLPEEFPRPRMTLLRTFTFAQAFFSESKIEWATIEMLTGPDIMPVKFPVHSTHKPICS